MDDNLGLKQLAKRINQNIQASYTTKPQRRNNTDSRNDKPYVTREHILGTYLATEILLELNTQKKRWEYYSVVAALGKRYAWFYDAIVLAWGTRLLNVSDANRLLTYIENHGNDWLTFLLRETSLFYKERVICAGVGANTNAVCTGKNDTENTLETTDACGGLQLQQGTNDNVDCPMGLITPFGFLVSPVLSQILISLLSKTNELSFLKENGVTFKDDKLCVTKRGDMQCKYIHNVAFFPVSVFVFLYALLPHANILSQIEKHLNWKKSDFYTQHFVINTAIDHFFENSVLAKISSQAQVLIKYMNDEDIISQRVFIYSIAETIMSLLIDVRRHYHKTVHIGEKNLLYHKKHTGRAGQEQGIRRKASIFGNFRIIRGLIDTRSQKNAQYYRELIRKHTSLLKQGQSTAVYQNTLLEGLRGEPLENGIEFTKALRDSNAEDVYLFLASLAYSTPEKKYGYLQHAKLIHWIVRHIDLLSDDKQKSVKMAALSIVFNKWLTLSLTELGLRFIMAHVPLSRFLLGGVLPLEYFDTIYEETGLALSELLDLSAKADSNLLKDAIQYLTVLQSYVTCRNYQCPDEISWKLQSETFASASTSTSVRMLSSTPVHTTVSDKGHQAQPGYKNSDIADNFVIQQNNTTPQNNKRVRIIHPGVIKGILYPKVKQWRINDKKLSIAKYQWCCLTQRFLQHLSLVKTLSRKTLPR